MPSIPAARRALPCLAALATAAVALTAAPASASPAARLAPATRQSAATRARSAARATSYPFAKGNPAVIDPWGAYERQCTSFAAWALAREGATIFPGGKLRGPHGTRQLGNAGSWDAVAKADGFRVSRTPVAGAVAQWHDDETSSWSIGGENAAETAGPTGHVGIVKKVLPHGLALIDDYNGDTPLGFHEYVGKAPRYLVITRR